MSVYTPYDDGIYQDIDGDIVLVDDNQATLIGTGHNGDTFIDLNLSTKIADLPRNQNVSLPVPAPEPVKPTLADGVYKDSTGEIVQSIDGVISSLLPSDSCPDHNDYWQSDHADLDDLVLLTGNPIKVVPFETPRDGVYTDKDGDFTLFKNGKGYWFTPFEAPDFSDPTNDPESYAPYTSLVEAK